MCGWRSIRESGQWMNGFEDWVYYQLMDGYHWFTVVSSTVHSLYVCVFLSVFG